MLQQDQFHKLKDDYHKIKKLSVDLSLHVAQLEQQIKREMVSETKFKIALELMEKEVREETIQQNRRIEEKLIPKIKKRLKFVDLADKFKEKVSLMEFKQTVSNLNDKISYLTDKVGTELPAIQYDVKTKIANTIDKETFHTTIKDCVK